MAALRGTATAGGTSSPATVTLTKPTGLAAGDVILFFASLCAITTGKTFAYSSGAALTDNIVTAGDFGCYVAARVCDGTETSWVFNNTFLDVSMTAIAYSGASNFDPATLPTPICTSANSTTVIPNPYTMANGGDWLVFFGGENRNGSTTGSTWAGTPTGYTLQSGPTKFSAGSSLATSVAWDLETAQSAGLNTPPTYTKSISTPVTAWGIAVSFGTSGSATLTVPGLALTAPIVSPAASVQQVPLTTAGLGLSAPNVAPSSSAVAVLLSTAGISMAAPLLAVQSASTVALSKPNLALAAPLLTPSATVQQIALTTPNMALNAPLVSIQNSTAVALTTPVLRFQAFPVNPTTINPVYINPWYGNQLDPLDSDFEGPAVP